jgi:hypothetical protein
MKVLLVFIRKIKYIKGFIGSYLIQKVFDKNDYNININYKYYIIDLK